MKKERTSGSNLLQKALQSVGETPAIWNREPGLKENTQNRYQMEYQQTLWVDLSME